MSRPFAKRIDVLWLILLLAIALGGWAYLQFRPQWAARAEVYVGAQQVMVIDLSESTAKDLTVPGAPGVVLHLDGQGGIAFSRSDCPDQICVAAGRLSRAGESAACLPNRVFIRLVAAPGQAAEADVVVGGQP